MTVRTADIVELDRRTSRYSALAFDLDGTLYDTRDFERPALAAVVEWLRARSGAPLCGAEEKLWQRRESDRHRPGLFDTMLEAYQLPREWGPECLRVFRAYQGVELAAASSLSEFLQSRVEGGCSLAVVTNGLPDLQTRKLRMMGMGEMFDRVICCDPRRPEELKPSRWAWEQLSDWRKGRPVVYVGDDLVDAEFAAAGGAEFVHFSFRSSAYEY